MDANSRLLNDEFIRIQLLANTYDWPLKYIEFLRTFMDERQPISLRAALLVLGRIFFWRHNIKKLSPTLRSEILKQVTGLQGKDTRWLFDALRIRAYLGDISILQELDETSTTHLANWKRIQLLAWINEPTSTNRLAEFLNAQDDSVQLEAALALVAHGKSDGKPIIRRYYREDYEDYGRNLEVAVTLARFGDRDGIGFFFHNFAESIRHGKFEMQNFLEVLKDKINQYEPDVELERPNWFQNYLVVLSERGIETYRAEEKRAGAGQEEGYSDLTN